MNRILLWALIFSLFAGIAWAFTLRGGTMTRASFGISVYSPLQIYDKNMSPLRDKSGSLILEASP